MFHGPLGIGRRAVTSFFLIAFCPGVPSQRLEDSSWAAIEGRGHPLRRLVNGKKMSVPVFSSGRSSTLSGGFEEI